MDAVVEAIYELAPEKIVEGHLSKYDREKIEALDAKGFDLVHHCILAGNLEAAKHLWLKGLFMHEKGGQPNVLPYIHLACLTGRAQLIPLIVAHRPPSEMTTRVSGRQWIDVKAVSECLRKAEPNSKAWEKIEKAYNSLPADEDEEHLIPLDTAAIGGNVNCIKALLAVSQQNTKGNNLERIVELRSHRALQVFLKSGKQMQDHIDSAFKSALRRKLPQCLDILIKFGVKASNVLNQLNPYHVLYMYSSAYQIRGAEVRNAGLDECTAVLIKHGFDVNVKLPLGSYPLYSIIHSLVTEKDQFPNKIPIYHINAFIHLLNAGANTNFDENAYLQEMQRQSQDQALLIPTSGRDLFSSGLNALLSMIQNSDTYRAHHAEHLDRCCLSLLEHGADPHYIDTFGETPLHNLVKALAMQHALGHVNVDFGTMIRLLLIYGADPNMKSTSDIYAVHYYFTVLLNFMGGLIAFTRWKAADNAAHVLHLLYYMDMEAALCASNSLMESLRSAGRSNSGDASNHVNNEAGDHGNQTASAISAGGDAYDHGDDYSDDDEGLGHGEEPVPEPVLHYVQELVAEFVYKPKSLQDACRMVVWRSVGRDRNKLRMLPMPRALRTGVLDLFMLDIDF